MSQLIASWTLNVKTVSEANSTEHWTKKSKRHQQQQLFVRLAFNQLEKPIELPCRVVLTRLAERSLDSDNNVSAFKWIRDEISHQLIKDKARGQADSDPRISWEYKQEKRKLIGVKIEVLSD